MFKKLRKKILMGALIATASSAPLITPVISSTPVMASEAFKIEKNTTYGITGNESTFLYNTSKTYAQWITNNKVNKINLTNGKTSIYNAKTKKTVENTFASTNLKGKYVYVDKNGKFGNTFTGVVQSAETGDWVFVRKGIYDNTFTGVAQSTTENWVYVSKGRYNTSFTGIAKSINGNWLYVSKGRWSNKTNVDYKVRKGENIEQYAIINGRVHHAAIYNAKTGEDVGLIRYTNTGAVREKYTKISTNNWSHYIYEGGKIVKFERLNDKGEIVAVTNYQ